MSGSGGPDRRGALLQVKLAALVREHWGAEGERGGYPSGATLIAPGARGWVLLDRPDHRALGGVLAWAHQRAVGEIHLLVDRAPGPAGILARRAAAFSTPVEVWTVEDRVLRRTEPEALPGAPELAPAVAAFVPLLRAQGVDPVVEHGALRGEVLGLEVARVVIGTGEPHMEVGVGRHDREAQELLFPHRDPAEALAIAVSTVRRLRLADAQPHLASTLAPERWMRSVVIAHPDLVGAARLEAVAAVVPPPDLQQAAPAPAAGVDLEGRPLVVVCTTGVDLDAVPAAAEARAADGRPSCRLVVAVPAAAAHPSVTGLLADLREPADLVAVPADWRERSPVP